MFMFGRNQHKSIKQLSYNFKNKLVRKEKNYLFNSHSDPVLNNKIKFYKLLLKCFGNTLCNLLCLVKKKSECQQIVINTWNHFPLH